MVTPDALRPTQLADCNPIVSWAGATVPNQMPPLASTERSASHVPSAAPASTCAQVCWPSCTRAQAEVAAKAYSTGLASGCHSASDLAKAKATVVWPLGKPSSASGLCGRGSLAMR